MSVVEDFGAFLAEALPAHRAEWGDDDGQPARLAWQRRLAAARWVGLAWPETHGGRGLGIADRLAVELQMTTAGAPPLAGFLGVNNVGPTLIHAGTPAQHRWLPPILTGEHIWCQGFSEPDAGSDLASLRTRAELVGDRFVVNGQKIWTSAGPHATHCLLLARTDPHAPRHRGISALAFPLDRPGVERRPIRQIDGQAEFAELFFTDVEVPTDALVGPLHDGWRVTMTTLGYERAGLVSLAVLLERDVLALLAWAATLESGGCVPPDTLMRHYVDGRVLGFLGHRALARIAGGQPGPEDGALIRLAQSTLRQRVAETRVACAGPAAVAGLLPDATQELLHSRAATIAAGTAEILKTVLAERVLGLPRS
jgi:alkylation response protein AidB-like acyl-CoA dehydrogenase